MKNLVYFLPVLLFISCKSDDDQSPELEEINVCIIFKNQSIIGLSDFQFKILDKDGNTLLLDRTHFNKENCLKMQKNVPVSLELYVKDNCRDFVYKKELGTYSLNDNIEVVINDEVLQIDSVYEGDIEIKNQEELDAFGCQGYKKINGRLSIHGVNNLNSLINLEEIKGWLLIGSSFFTSNGQSTFLQNKRNLDLKSLSGLDNLVTIEGGLVIHMSGISDLSGLTNLENLETLVIGGNDNLVSLKGASKLKKISKNFYLGGLATWMCDFTLSCAYISGNTNLETLSGLNVEHIGENFAIRGSGIRNFEGLSNMKNIGTLIVSSNAKLVNFLGFPTGNIVSNNITIGEYLNFRLNFFNESHNPALDNLKGLEGITSLKGKLSIGLNDKLTSLDGLENLQSAKNITIFSNPLLTSLEGLSSLISVENLNIGSGPKNSDNDSSKNDGNPFLKDFCALKNTTITGRYEVIHNGYNPTKEQLTTDQCKVN
ncbi:hypothetical protein ATE84_0800 [Aquimarina sp. MAR_2010_214]|uniref:hypothetical protein n=1 Tax=Aquimarina sp. MAR_2010_214 TaxID=1250026 RepID=UPI000C7122BA|nr:hypothetical protein [Aquimarina sp. MAR_2010_214]PKV48788.1 hypothetical protein ATE84_0800 [Aquimarina sp. MAR_2010_214]